MRYKNFFCANCLQVRLLSSHVMMSRVTSLLKISPQCGIRQCSLIPQHHPFLTQANPHFFIPFPHCPLANQAYVGNVPQLSINMIMIRGHLKIGEVTLTKLRPGWRQLVVHFSTMWSKTAGVHRVYSFDMICTQIVDNTKVKWREKTSPSLLNPEKKNIVDNYLGQS
jgi:hypothetical protein